MDDERTVASRPSRSPFQFSLATMLILTAMAAVLCSIFFALPALLAYLALIALLLLLPALPVVMIVYGSPNHRAFAIGAMPPGLAMFAYGLALVLDFELRFDGLLAKSGSRVVGLRVFIFLMIALAVVSGFLCAGLKGSLDESRSRARENLPSPRPSPAEREGHRD